MGAPEHALRPMIDIQPVTDAYGVLQSPALLAAAEAVHRQLRPQLPADYAGEMTALFGHGGRMTVATDNGQVRGVMVWRVLHKTSSGRELYVDDLVTDEARRSHGVGRQLLTWIEAEARRLGCRLLALDSGTRRERAHRFYFREGMTITAFRFTRAL